MNQIILGDCLEKMKDIADNTIDLIVTDPPYLMDYKTGYRKNKRSMVEHDFKSTIDGDNDFTLIEKFIEESYRLLKDNSAMYVFCNSLHVDYFKQSLEKHFDIKNQIIWVKNNWTAGDLEASFGRQYEIIFLVNKGRKKINGKRLTDIWQFDRISGDKQIHQNQKPIPLIRQCIEKHSNKGDLILDPFSGSGTTAIACIDTNRNYICIEKDKKYHDLMETRINNHKKQEVLFS